MELSKKSLNKIFEFHGYDTQVKKLSEEMFEVLQALILKDRDNLTEEIGDLYVLLDQFIQKYQLDKADIMHSAKGKVKRECDRIGGSYYRKVIGGNYE